MWRSFMWTLFSQHADLGHIYYCAKHGGGLSKKGGQLVGHRNCSDAYGCLFHDMQQFQDRAERVAVCLFYLCIGGWLFSVNCTNPAEFEAGSGNLRRSVRSCVKRGIYEI